MAPWAWKQRLLVAVLFIIAVIGLLPYLLVAIGALKNNAQFYGEDYWQIPWPMHWANYGLAWHLIAGYMANSAIIAAGSIVGVLALSTGSAYVFARFSFPAREYLYWMLIALLTVPSIATLVPLFVIIKDFGLIDTRWALWLPYVAGGQIFGIFLIRAFIEKLPAEVFDAAKLDGASHYHVFRFVALPLSTPIITTVAIMTLINVWNDYVWPSLTISSNSLMTVTVGLAYFQGQYVQQWGELFAGYIIASLPLLVVFALGMRYFVSGLTAGVT